MALQKTPEGKSIHPPSNVIASEKKIKPGVGRKRGQLLKQEGRFRSQNTTVLSTRKVPFRLQGKGAPSPEKGFWQKTRVTLKTRKREISKGGMPSRKSASSRVGRKEK